MPMTMKDIETAITNAIPDADVEINDLRGDGDHYAVRVRSSKFAGLTRVKQHQLVYQALGSDMGTTLHAMALQTEAK